MHRLRTQKTTFFLVIRDGTSYVQCILTGDCIKTIDALDLTVESTVELCGTVEKVKEGSTAPGGVEVVVDWWRIVGRAPAGEDAFEGRLRAVSGALGVYCLSHGDLPVRQREPVSYPNILWLSP